MDNNKDLDGLLRKEVHSAPIDPRLLSDSPPTQWATPAWQEVRTLTPGQNQIQDGNGMKIEGGAQSNSGDDLVSQKDAECQYLENGREEGYLADVDDYAADHEEEGDPEPNHSINRLVTELISRYQYPDAEGSFEEA